MALIIGDLHGDIEKLKAFLKHKPDEEHIHVGDICDDWTASDKQIEDTIKLCFVKKSKLINLVGNHDINYMAFPPFNCSGHRWQAEKTYDLIRKHEKKFKMAVVRDDFLITHGGVDAYFNRHNMTVEDIADYIENQWQRWLTSDRFVGYWREQDIFWISRVSGGTSEYGGPLWARPGFDNVDKAYSQVFGHTERRDGPRAEYFDPNTGVIHFNVDGKRYICFNTKTRQLETFGHGLTTKEFELLKRDIK